MIPYLLLIWQSTSCTKLLEFNLSDLFTAFQCILSQSKWDGTVWSFTLDECFAVILPRLIKCAVVVNFLTHTGSRIEPCQLTSVSILCPPPRIYDFFHFLDVSKPLLLCPTAVTCADVSPLGGSKWLIFWKTMSEAGISTLQSSCCTIGEILHGKCVSFKYPLKVWYVHHHKV